MWSCRSKADSISENRTLASFSSVKSSVKSIRSNLLILRHDEAQRVEDVLPGMLHALLAVLFLFSHKAQRMEGEEIGVLLAAVSHPFDTSM